jgi:hypothetical protein
LPLAITATRKNNIDDNDNDDSDEHKEYDGDGNDSGDGKVRKVAARYHGNKKNSVDDNDNDDSDDIKEDDGDGNDGGDGKVRKVAARYHGNKKNSVDDNDNDDSDDIKEDDGDGNDGGDGKDVGDGNDKENINNDRVVDLNKNGKNILEKSLFKRGAWTVAEYDILVELVKRWGRTWVAIQKKINRSANSCRKKYLGIAAGKRNVASITNSFKRGAWTEEECDMLVQLVQRIGRKWVAIQVIINRPAKTCRDKYRGKAKAATEARARALRIHHDV